ncbi:hypothetical protein PLESTB_000128100 [Pleodorina starrii]|uniref:phytol kinase n=1 Tax=Pleodorina starrii TaxID=330485 RepID=A0A9W6BAV1_9CHLO|nr:hypothetical protein PLESTM_000487200 [Pleodorina starrii]GLC48708.1 hypothetical protein PLESTB_000128100 [Pleodorina starrii]GLC74259.1 hypothetical protein PLESTF_001482000 [Pleodorina starrii]
MEDHLLATLSELRRCRDRLAGPARPVTGAREEQAIRLRLDRARRAAEAIASAAAAAAGTSEALSACRPPADYDPELVARKAVEAASYLGSVADILSVATDSPQLGTQADASSAVAAEAHSLVTHIARSLARLQQLQVFRSVDAARAALAAGDPAAAASAALRAEEAAAVVMWVASVGGWEVVREARAAQRAAAEVMEAAEAAAAGPQRQGEAADREHRPQCAGATTSQQSDTGAAAVPTSTGGPFSSSPSSSSSSGSSTAMAVVVGSSVAAAASPAAVATAVAMAATSTVATAESVEIETRETVAAAASAAAAAMTSVESRAATVAAAPAAAEAAASAVAEAAAPSNREAGAAAPAGAGAPAAATETTGPAPAATTITGAESGEALAIAAAAAEVVTAPASGGMVVAAAGRLTEAVSFEAGAAATAATAAVATATDGSVRVTPAAPTTTEAMTPERTMPAVAAPTATVTTTAEGSTPCNPASILSYMAGLADQATPDGRVPSAALTEAVRMCNAAMEPQNYERLTAHTAAAAAAWADPKTRYRLVKLLSYAARQLLVVAPAAGESDLESYDEWQLAHVLQDVGGEVLMPWSHVVMFIMHSINKALLGLGPGTGPLQAAGPEVIRLLVRTDLVQCLARMSAAMVPPITSSTIWPVAILKRSMRMKAMLGVEQALDSLVSAFGISDLCPGQPKAQAAARELRGAVLRSRALEHLTRAAMPMMQHADAAAAAAVSADGSGPAGQGPLVAVVGQADERGQARGILRMVAGIVNNLLTAAVQNDRPTAVWANAMLAGDCVQYFLVLHVVSQLCAADGGPDYGLPAGARLPAYEVEDDGEQAPARRGSTASRGARTASGPLRLRADVVARAFGWWARNTRTTPCSGRALRAVCERAAAAAHASLAADRGEDAAVAAAAAAAAGESIAVQGRFSPPGDAVAMAAAALHCAAARTPDGADGVFRGLWEPVVQTANAAVHVRPRAALLDAWTPLRLLLALPLPPLGVSPEDMGPQFLPPQPGPDLAAALAAGYLPALERTIRNEARLAGASPQQLAPVLQGICSLLGISTGGGLVGLMAYGNPTEVAALLVTLGKVIRVARSAITDDQTTALLVKFLDATLWVYNLAGHGSGTADRHWWRPYHSGHFGDSGAPSSSTSGGRCGQPGAGADAGGRSEGNGGGDRSLPPLQQLSLLGAFSAYRWLRGLGCTPECGSPQFTVYAYCTVLRWLPPLLHAYLNCSRDLEGPDGGPAALLPATSAAGDGSGGKSGLRAVGIGSSSWERLLLREVDVPRVIGITAEVAYSSLQTADGRAAEWMGFAKEIAVVALHLVIAFPSQGRAVLRAPVKSAGPRKTTLLDWLREALAAGGDSRLCDDFIRHFLELAPAVAAGREPGPEDLARLQRVEGDCGRAALVGALLPPPCVVAAALQQLPLCANPWCTKLEGDSDAGLVGTGRKGSSGASYCCRACQLAHTRATAGHKGERSAGARGGARR